MKNIIFIIFCLAQACLHCMDQLARLDSQPDLLDQTTPRLVHDLFGLDEIDGAYFPQSATPRAGEWPSFPQSQIAQGLEAETLGAKRRRSPILQAEPEESAEAEPSRKITPKELATKARRFAEAHYANLNLGPREENKNKVIKANAIPGLSSKQAQMLEEYHKSFLEKQTEVKRLLSDKPCWKNGTFVCTHKKLSGVSCNSHAIRRSAALIHIEGRDHLNTGAYFCIPCLLAGKMHINPQTQNIRTHIEDKHGPEHVESGVGMLSAMDGYNANTPEDKPVEPEGQQQQEPADKQSDMRVSTYKVDAPQPNVPVQSATQHVQIETRTLKIDAGIQTEQAHEVATQTDDPREHQASPPQKKRRIEDPAAFLDKKRTEHSQATKLCTFFYNLNIAWRNSATFVCPCKISENADCGLKISKHEHKYNFRQVVLEHLSTVHFDRKNSYCGTCLANGKWIAGSNKEVREHAKFLHNNDISCVQRLSSEKICNTLNHRADSLEANTEAIYLTTETTKTRINLDDLGNGQKISKEKALKVAREIYLESLRARFCCQRCLEQNILSVRDTENSINNHIAICHTGEEARIIDLATHKV